MIGSLTRLTDRGGQLLSTQYCNGDLGVALFSWWKVFVCLKYLSNSEPFRKTEWKQDLDDDVVTLCIGCRSLHKCQDYPSRKIPNTFKSLTMYIYVIWSHRKNTTQDINITVTSLSIHFPDEKFCSFSFKKEVSSKIMEIIWSMGRQWTITPGTTAN